VAGEILSMRYNQEKGRFLLEFVPDFSIKAPTEVYIPLLQFPQGAFLSAWGATFYEPQHSIEKGTKSARIVAEPTEFLVLQVVAEEGAPCVDSWFRGNNTPSFCDFENPVSNQLQGFGSKSFSNSPIF